jgi:hypothetical protein
VAALVVTGSAATAAPARSQFIVEVGNSADYNAVRSKASGLGATVVRDLKQIRRLVIVGTSAQSGSLASDSRVTSVALDQVSSVGPPESTPSAPAGVSVQQATLGAPTQSVGTTATGFTPDPAFGYAGLMWNYDRIGATQAWNATTGSPSVTVGVSDTGLDYTHSELASKVDSVVDFTVNEDPPLCKTFFGTSDQELAKKLHAPADTDFFGHGTWIGGAIAAAADGKGINGIAPSVRLVSLKIAQWCGFAFDSTILDSFLYAADHGIPLVNISFGGYLDFSDPSQSAVYRAYKDAVAYAKGKGTTIVAAAGNEHTRVGNDGRVTSHGTLTIPGDSLFDAFNQYEVPGGIPGVVDVASVGNVVVGSSPSCPSGTTGANATCKPASDAHQPFGVGQQNQLTYYSNYGSRIDVAGPGGARKFNVPNADRGGTPGFPYTTADGFTAFEDFGITSNFAQQIPCFVLNSTAGFPKNQCYTGIQGTSMAAPQAVGVMALILSANRTLNPDGLVTLLKSNATAGSNTTPGLSATDTSGGDRTGGSCPTGYCHLGGSAITNSEVYGAGVVNAGFLAP